MIHNNYIKRQEYLQCFTICLEKVEKEIEEMDEDLKGEECKEEKDKEEIEEQKTLKPIMVAENKLSGTFTFSLSTSIFRLQNFNPVATHFAEIASLHSSCSRKTTCNDVYEV